MRVHLHGALRSRYGEHIDIEASTAAEAIEGLSVQLPDWPRNMVIEVPGFETEERLHNVGPEELHLVPAMYGGGGKFGQILIGAALIAAAAYFGPAGAGMIMGKGLTAGAATAMMSVGIGMMLNGVMALFMKAPSISKSEDPPASKYFGNSENTAESGTPIPLLYGCINVFGHWVSLQSDADKLVTGVFPTVPT